MNIALPCLLTSPELLLLSGAHTTSLGSGEAFDLLHQFSTELNTEVDSVAHPTSETPIVHMAEQLAIIKADEPDHYAAALQGLQYVIGLEPSTRLFRQTWFSGESTIIRPLTFQVSNRETDDHPLDLSEKETSMNLTLSEMPLEIHRYIGVEIQRLRRARSLNSKQLVELLGMEDNSSASAMHFIETGQQHTNWPLLFALQRIFGLESLYFFKLCSMLLDKGDVPPFISEKVRLKKAHFYYHRAARLKMAGELTSEHIREIIDEASVYQIHNQSFALADAPPQTILGPFSLLLSLLLKR